jgi:hypothetical protein
VNMPTGIASTTALSLCRVLASAVILLIDRSGKIAWVYRERFVDASSALSSFFSANLLFNTES